MLSWKQCFKNSPDDVSSIEMILIDEQGFKVCCSVYKCFFGDHDEGLLKEGNFLEIANFGVIDYKVDYKLTESPYLIRFFRNTKVRRVSAFQEASDGFNLLPLDVLMNGSVSSTNAFDVVGALSDVFGMKINEDSGKEKSVINFEIQDNNGVKIRCALWGDYAFQLSRFLDNNKESNDQVIMTIQNARLGKDFLGNPQVTNQLYGCRLHINSDISPINAFKSVISVSTQAEVTSTPVNKLQPNTVIMNVLNEFKDETLKTVYELRSTEEVSTCALKATIVRFVHEDGWFFSSCDTCNFRVKFEGVSTEGVPLYNCINCGKITQVGKTVRAMIRVKDETGITSLVLFDTQLAKLLDKTVKWLSAKLTKIPNEFLCLNNMEVACIVKVTEYNIKKGIAGYTIVKSTFDPKVFTYLAERLFQKAVEENQEILGVEDSHVDLSVEETS